MRKLGLILLLIVVLFFLYLVWSYFASSTSDTLVVPAGQAGTNKISQGGKDVKNLQADILSSAIKKIDSVKSFVEQIPEAATNAFNDLIDKTKDTAREKLITILEATSSPVSQPLPGSPVTGGDTPQNSSTEPHVCFVVSKGELVGYGIDQPFPGMEGTSYKITWGDGEAVNGAFHSGDKNVVVSHSYAEQGTYSIVFQLISGATTLTASRSVCVKG